MQIISGLKAEVCYRKVVFVLVTCSSNGSTTFWIWYRITGTNLCSLWSLFQKKWWKHQCLTWENLHRKLLTDGEVLMPVLWFRDLSELWSHKYGKLKPTANWNYTSVFSTMRFYTQKIENHFLGAKHKAKKTFFTYYILYKPLSK